MPISSKLLHSHAQALYSLLLKTYVKSSGSWKTISDAIWDSVDCLNNYQEYLNRKKLIWVNTKDIWHQQDRRNINERLIEAGWIIQKLRPVLRECHTRDTQKSDFTNRIKNISSIKPALLEMIYLVLDSSTASHPDTIQIICAMFLGPEGLVANLRHLNPWRLGNHLSPLMTVVMVLHTCLSACLSQFWLKRRLRDAQKTHSFPLKILRGFNLYPKTLIHKVPWILIPVSSYNTKYNKVKHVLHNLMTITELHFINILKARL